MAGLPLARRTQAERSEAMRSRLAAAAYAAVAEGGLSALTMRNVAAAAGVSPGALLHHFPDKQALIIAAIAHALTLAREDSAVWLEARSETPDAALRAMLAEFRGFFFSDRFWVAMGITIETTKDRALGPAVRREVGELRSPIYRQWAQQLERAGWAPAEAVKTVRAGASLVSGAAVRRFWAESDAVTAEIEEDWIAGRLARLEAKPRPV
jgi:AcrR family transcriptional regulator